MKAVAVYPGNREVKVIDIAEPGKPAPGQVKLRMLEVGVCGTDKEICAWVYGSPPEGSDHFVLGHESLGEVMEIGSGVEDLRTGDLVVSTVRLPCTDADCVPCRAGQYDFCSTGHYREHGIMYLDGFMTEQLVEERHNLHPVARELRDVGVLVEPLGAMLLVNEGYETYIYSRSPKPNAKAAVGEAIGAKYISSEQTTIEQMAEQVGNIDLVYEAVGASKFAFDVLKYLGSNGIFVFTGVPRGEKPMEIDTERIMYNLVLKNQVLLGTVNAGPLAFDNAVRDLGVFNKRWPQALRAMITGRYPLEAFHDLVMGTAGGIKNVLAISEAGKL